MKKLTTVLVAALIAASASSSVAALSFKGETFVTNISHGVKPTPKVPIPEVPPTSDGKNGEYVPSLNAVCIGIHFVCIGISWDLVQPISVDSTKYPAWLFPPMPSFNYLG